VSNSANAKLDINEIANKRYSTLEEELNSTDYDHQDDRDKLIKQMDELSGIISYCEDIKNGNQNNAAAEAESENRRLMEEQAGSNPNDMGWSIFKNGINQVSADDISARWKKKLQDNLGSFKQEFKDNAKQEALEAAQKEEDSNKPEDDKPKNDVPQMGTGEGALNRAPAQYKPLIMKYSQENGVDPRLVAAIIETESGWNPNAVSDAGAIGLGQFMPSTAESVGIDPTNPEQSIQGVAMHMKSLLGTFNNDSIKAIAAYNAGAGAVKDAGGVPNFAETQNYVKKVMAAISGSGGALNNSGGTGGLTLSSPQTPSQKMQTAETNYASLLGKMGAHTIKGRIINEMYVDQSQTYESINEINTFKCEEFALCRSKSNITIKKIK
jgi:soluble lytic murein transglycosylase-like protein